MHKYARIRHISTNIYAKILLTSPRSFISNSLLNSILILFAPIMLGSINNISPNKVTNTHNLY